MPPALINAIAEEIKPRTLFEFNAIAKEYLGFRTVWLLRSEILVFNFGFFGPEQRINVSSANVRCDG
jgi:hypothetical protein